MNDYTNHNDSAGLAARLRTMAHESERARVLAVQAEADAFSITLFMSKRELLRRRAEAERMFFLEG
jgi:hypothetical protein